MKEAYISEDPTLLNLIAEFSVAQTIQECVARITSDDFKGSSVNPAVG
jgi:hypothetical protein